MKMNSLTKIIGALLIGGLICANVSAATVTFTLDLTGAPGTFTLRAAASAGDNSGITTYGVPLSGPILTVDHRSPNAVASGNFQPAGFTNLRSLDGLASISASQPLPPNPNQITGFGQTASDWVTKLGGPPLGSPDPTADNPWAVPLVIATGTYNPAQGKPGFQSASADLLANVYAQGDTQTRIPATVLTEVLEGGTAPNIVLNALGEREVGAGVILANGMTNAGDPPITWSNLTPVAGPGLGVPSIAATLSPTGQFSWNPVGSKAGKKGSGSVLYQWTATATNSFGADSDVAFSVILIPEPATLSLIGLAVIGLVGAARRRS